MNRIIKFRAWHKEEKKMCEVLILNPIDKNAFLIGIRRGDGQLSSGGKFYVPAPNNGRNVPFEEIELMQFTGLLDKNGKEIYDGDVVKSEIGYSSNLWVVKSGKFEISQEGECSCSGCSHSVIGLYLDKVTNADSSYAETDEIQYGEWLTIIGNVYESPSVLTQ